MKTRLLSMVAVVALTAVAAPAAAQTHGYRDRDDRYEQRYDREDHYDRGGHYDRRDHYDRGDRYDRRGRNDEGDRLQWRIQRAVERGIVSRAEGARLRGYAVAVETLANRYRRDGDYTRWERGQIEQRYASIERRIQMGGRDHGYGYGQGYGYNQRR